MNVVMLLSRAFYPDPRVLKEAKALAAAGARVLIWAWDRSRQYPQTERYGDIVVQRLRIGAQHNVGPSAAQVFRWLAFTSASLAQLSRQKWDVVHCHDLDTLPLGYLLARVLRTRLIFDAHEPNYYAYWHGLHRGLLGPARWLERTLSRRADAVLVTNEFQRAKYARTGVRRVFLVPNYPELETVKSLDSLDGNDDSRGTVCFGRVGAIYKDTGFDEIVQAFGRAISRVRSIRLRIAGRVHDGYLARFQELRRQIGPWAEITGAYDHRDLARIYEGLDVSVLPYKRTAWFRDITPVKFFESLSLGVPVIATAVGGIGEIVRERNCGLVLPDANPADLEEAIVWMAEHGQSRREMGARGLEAIYRSYNWDAARGDLLKAYDHVAGTGARQAPIASPRQRGR